MWVVLRVSLWSHISRKMLTQPAAKSTHFPFPPFLLLLTSGIMSAITHGKCEQLLLRKALRLYTMTNIILADQLVATSKHPRPLDLLKLALATYQRHIYSHFAMYSLHDGTNKPPQFRNKSGFSSTSWSSISKNAAFKRVLPRRERSRLINFLHILYPNGYIYIP